MFKRKHRKVGKKKFNTIADQEIRKLEEQRPPRIIRIKKTETEDGVLMEAIDITNPETKAIQDSIESDIQLFQVAKTTSSARKTTPYSNPKKKDQLRANFFFKPCVYILWQNEQMVYIGQTTDLARRISEHRETKNFEYFSVYMHIEDEYNRLKVEEILIKKHKPKYNVVHK